MYRNNQGNIHVYDWENKMALQQSTRTTLQCKKTWYGRQMKYILMNNNAYDIQKHDVQIKQMALR